MGESGETPSCFIRRLRNLRVSSKIEFRMLLHVSYQCVGQQLDQLVTQVAGHLRAHTGDPNRH
jgi:hypothetical protein